MPSVTVRALDVRNGCSNTDLHVVLPRDRIISSVRTNVCLKFSYLQRSTQI